MFYAKPDVVDYSRLKEMDMYPDYDSGHVTNDGGHVTNDGGFAALNMSDLYTNTNSIGSGNSIGNGMGLPMNPMGMGSLNNLVPMYQGEGLHDNSRVTHDMGGVTRDMSHVTRDMTHDTGHVTHDTSHVTHNTHTNHNHSNHTNTVTPNSQNVTHSHSHNHNNNTHNTNNVTHNTNNVTNATHNATHNTNHVTPNTTSVTPNTQSVTTTTSTTTPTATSPQIPFTVAPPAPSGKYVTDDERWQALVDRDPEADGAFIYCVTSTKVYCRPTCSARLALRSNIVYFDTMKEAVAAGYRPCRRCNPDVSEMNSQRRAVGSVCNLIHSLEPDKVPRVKKLAESVGLTLWHFHRLFKRYTGLTPRQYITEFHKRKRLGLPQLQVSKVVTKKSYERQQRRKGSQGGSNGSTPQLSPQPGGEVDQIKLEYDNGDVTSNMGGVTSNMSNVTNDMNSVTGHTDNVTNNMSSVTTNTTSTTAPSSAPSSASSVATPLSNTTSPENSADYVIQGNHGNANTNTNTAPQQPVAAPSAPWIKTEPTMDFMPRYEPRYDQSISIDAPMFIPDGEYHLGEMWGGL